MAGSRIEGVIYARRLAALKGKLARMGKSSSMIKALERLSRDINSGALFRRVERRVNATGVMSDIMTLRFLQGRTHAGGGRKWRKLSASTLKYRRFPGAPILIQTGKLAGMAAKAVRNTFSMTKMPLWEPLLGKVAVAYAEYHEHGTGKMPARPFMGNPTMKELAPAMAMARKFMDQEIDKIMRSAR